MSKLKQCSACGSKKVKEVVFIENVPAHCNVLWYDRTSALNCPMGGIQLVFCEDCGHLYNGVFNEELMTYTQEYENTLDFSPAFQKYSRELISDLTENYDLNGKDIIEIGCGKGDFLRMICKHGKNHGYGFDKSYDPSLADEPEDGSVQFIQDFYSEKYAEVPADMVISRHVLEHIEQPGPFLSNIKEIVNGQEKTVFYIEVPNILYTLRDLGIWDLIYEHCSYFSPPSINNLFRELGFGVIKVSEKYHGQFLAIEAYQANGTPAYHTKDDVRSVQKLVEKFGIEFNQKMDFWKQKLDELSGQNKNIVVWGGGSKGVSFLNFLKTGDLIRHIVDINPRKTGKFVAGTGQEYIQPERLKELKPDVVIVMNPIYKDEIADTLKKMSLSPQILVA